MKTLNELTRRLFELHYQNNQCHLSSSLSLLQPLWEIYQRIEKPKIVLSYAHAAYAWYIILEHLKLWSIPHPAPIHPPKSLIGYTAGSLGHGLPIALGMALAKPNEKIHCFVSDGELAEGSMAEAYNIFKKYSVHNLNIYQIYNGMSGNNELFSANNYIKLDQYADFLSMTPAIFNAGYIYETYPFLKPIDAHYYKLTKEDMEWINIRLAE